MVARLGENIYINRRCVRYPYLLIFWAKARRSAMTVAAECSSNSSAPAAIFLPHPYPNSVKPHLLTPKRRLWLDSCKVTHKTVVTIINREEELRGGTCGLRLGKMTTHKRRTYRKTGKTNAYYLLQMRWDYYYYAFFLSVWFLDFSLVAWHFRELTVQYFGIVG